MEQEWEILERVFSEALELPPEERLLFVKEQSGDNLWLRQELESLLAVPETKADAAFNSGTGIVRELLAALDSEYAVGREIGGYRIQALLSSGGMGIVYKAVEIATGEPVALKLLPPEDSQNPQRIRRLAREASVLAKLRHPGVVRIREYRSQPGGHFLVMELVAGETLQTLLAAGPLSLSQALDWAAQMAAAVEAAHAQHVVHRDLKPSNVMIERATGRVKLLDFGLARMADAEPSTHTQTSVEGTVAGTFSYFSPEQANGGRGDERSDIFSFGVVFYEMISGRRAFGRPGPAAAAAAVLTEAPDPLPAYVPRPVQALIERCLEKDPERRFATMRQAREAIEDLRNLERRGRLKPPVRKQTRVAAAVAAVLVLLAAASWFASRRMAVRQPVSIAVLPFQNLTPDADSNYLSSGLTAEITDALARRKTPRVLARSSAAQFAGKTVDWRKAGRALHVTHILQSSIERSGGQVKVVTSLARTSDGVSIWTNTYHRSVAEIGTIETDIEGRIAASLGGADSQPKTHIVLDQAHDYYLKARFEENRGTAEGNALAQEDYRRAIEIDPQYAAAYTALGRAIWARNIVARERPVWAERRKAELLWQTAIQLDPDFPAAHVSLGLYAEQYDWDWNRAEREFRAALSLGQDSGAEMSMAFLDLILGKRSEADDHLRRARDLDPYSLASATNAAMALQEEGRLAEAREDLRWVVAQNPSAVAWQIELAALESRMDKAGEGLANLRRLAKAHPNANMDLACAEAEAGNRAEAFRLEEPLERNYQSGDVTLFDFAAFYAVLDDEPNTVKWLERSMDAREAGPMHIRLYRDFAKMQDTPAFHALKKRMNLDW